ncbi:hypothetical protein EAH_00023170 [Eimeria acervulina]|uniref:Uncharacterized protein n=1 Tax=Eimeria acervulina TaxID=5801 RepID=U6GQ76_EIMAC|nr:hypothetical protein EAH_00023170 [Eimeria acervulina]CDI81717.1 hypothetical protein EAH_00023170 [Eimeria acervulina]
MKLHSLHANCDESKVTCNPAATAAATAATAAATAAVHQQIEGPLHFGVRVFYAPAQEACSSRCSSSMFCPSPGLQQQQLPLQNQLALPHEELQLEQTLEQPTQRQQLLQQQQQQVLQKKQVLEHLLLTQKLHEKQLLLQHPHSAYPRGSSCTDQLQQLQQLQQQSHLQSLRQQQQQHVSLARNEQHSLQVQLQQQAAEAFAAASAAAKAASEAFTAAVTAAAAAEALTAAASRATAAEHRGIP